MSAADPDPVPTTRATYELVAHDYETRNAGPTSDLAAARDRWLATLPPDARVLDAGAGPGHHAQAFVAAGRRAVALDLASAMTHLARRRGVPAVRGDLRRLPFGDGAFDAVWSAAALLHVPRDDAPATLAEWRRVMRPGGRLALMTATGGDDGWEPAPYAGADGARRWFVYHDAAGLTALLTAAGWRVDTLTERVAARRWLHVDAVAA